MDPKLPPETPTRGLLKRIHRRSTVLPAELASAISSSASIENVRSRRSSVFGPALTKETGELDETGNEEIPENDQVEDEDDAKAAWNQVEELLDTVQCNGEQILELEKRNSELERELEREKEKNKGLKDQKGEKGGLTRQAAIKLEREFLSQEMILKGLQRDNEEKTLEVESLRRKLKTLADFLARQYGEQDWEGVVYASSGSMLAAPAPSSPEKDFNEPPAFGLSAVARVLGTVTNSGNSSPNAYSKAHSISTNLGMENSNISSHPFSAAATPSGFLPSPNKKMAIDHDDMVIPAVARLQTPLASPTKPFSSDRYAQSVSGKQYIDVNTTNNSSSSNITITNATVNHTYPLTNHTDADASSGPHLYPQPTPAALKDLDPKAIKASLDVIGLLVQGYYRTQAIRRVQLEEAISSLDAREERVHKLKQETAALSSSSSSLPSISAATVTST